MGLSRNARSAARPAESSDALVRAAQQALDDGDLARARTLAERAVEAADAAPSSATGNLRARARCTLARVFLQLGDGPLAQRTGQEAARIALSARSHREQAEAELELAEIARVRGDFLAALRHGDKARLLAVKCREAPLLRSALAEYGLVLASLGDDRGQGVLAEAVAMPATGQSASRAFRVLHNAAMVHRAAGRYESALRLLDEAEVIGRGLRGLFWPVAAARILIRVEVGAIDEAHALLETAELPDDAPPRHLGQRFAFLVALAHAGGERPDVVERLANEGLALPALDPLTRVTLERLRAFALLGRGQVDEAERIAVGLFSLCAKGGVFAPASQAMALAARLGRPEAALLRWLGALALSAGGISARGEHEALAFLATEPDPIGLLARTKVEITRARLVASTPPGLRPALKRALRQVEAKAAMVRQTRRAEFETTLSAETLRAKEEVGLAGNSPPLLRAIGTLARAAKSDTCIVLSGETGSGKELFARLAHHLSARAGGQFVALNCAAIPEPLLEAELFGHERGAFTGAERARPGLFVEAQGGTLFLDEVGEMSAAMQAKLLRVLEEREVRAVGGSRARKVDVRVLAATHRELSAMVAARTFREDLYYRLAAITVRVPSLRERPEDIPVIAKALLARDAQMARLRLDVPALTALAEHSWPGNVRELANVLRVGSTLAEGNVIGREELADAIRSGASRALADEAKTKSALEETTLAALRARHRAELRELVGRAIASADGNKLRAARALGLSRQGLYRVLADLSD